jgi:thiol-disulfide isomerase/thioredoxin
MTALIAAIFIFPAQALPLVKPGAKLPPLELADLKGDKHNLRKMSEGKVILFVYWSLSCPHCRKEMPHLLELANQLKDNPFVMVFVNGDGPAMAPAVAVYAKDFMPPDPNTT